MEPEPIPSFRLPPLLHVMPMKLSLLGTACCALLLTTAFDTHAEDKRGRLADGRAYRTDAEGNQLVDYIAELELNIDTLNNQVRALEGDIEAKASLIEKLQQKQPPRALEEKNLIKASTSPDEVQECKAEMRRLRDEKVGLEQSHKAGCDERVREMKASLTQLNQELQGRDRRISLLEGAVHGTKREQEQAIRGVELQCKRDKEEATRAVAEKDRRIESLQAKLLNLDLEMQAAVREKERLLSVVDKESKRHEAETLKLSTELKRSKEEVLRMRDREKDSVVHASLRNDLVEATDNRARAIDLIKGKTTNDLTTLREMIRKRDELFVRVNNSNGAVKFTPTKAVTEDNQNLSTLEMRVAQARTVRELSLAMKDIQNIRSKIADDLNVITRFNR